MLKLSIIPQTVGAVERKTVIYSLLNFFIKFNFIFLDFINLPRFIHPNRNLKLR